MPPSGKSSSTSTVGPLETSLDTTAPTASKVARCNCSALSCARTALFSPWSIPIATKRSAVHSSVGAHPEDGFQAPQQGGSRRAPVFFEGNARPHRKQLLVKTVRARGRVRRRPAFQPQREAARTRPGPSHEKLAALLDDAGLSEPGLARDRRPRPPSQVSRLVKLPEPDRVRPHAPRRAPVQPNAGDRLGPQGVLWGARGSKLSEAWPQGRKPPPRSVPTRTIRLSPRTWRGQQVPKPPW